MDLFKLVDISKTYQEKGETPVHALKHVTLTFPSIGLIGILGKSGCGKTTLLNMLALFDTPTSGDIFFQNQSILKYKKEDIAQYHQNEIGMIFQHYNLLEQETAIFNIMLPALIHGENHNAARKDAETLLEGIGLKKELWEQKCKDLSGGEKQRVAILRALINNPTLVIADEPTGALDSKNSQLVMDALKRVSERKLVIMVTHNVPLAKKYCDRIVVLKDGYVAKDLCKNKKDVELPIIKRKKKKSNSKWIDAISSHNFKRRFKRNIASILSLIVGVTCSLLIIGFTNGAESAIKKATEKQFDYGVLTMSKEISYTINNSPLSIVQSSRPTSDELNLFAQDNDVFRYEINYDYLISPYLNICIGEEKLEEFSYNPIYSFTDSSVDSNLLIYGKMPTIDSLSEVIINKKAYDELSKRSGYVPLNSVISVSYSNEITYYTGDYIKPYINDIFVFEKNIKIVGVVDELSFLSTPKIYYSHLALKDYLEKYPLNNLSEYLEYEINYEDRLLMAGDNDALTSYSYRLFLKNYKDIARIDQTIDKYQGVYSFNCQSIIVRDTLLDLISASSFGMDIFLVIAIIGTILILGIVSFSSYSEDRKVSAILTSIGANNDDIINMYLSENMLICSIAIIISIISAIIFSYLGNYLLDKFLGISNMIDIPFRIFLNKPFMLPLLILLAGLFVCLVSTLLPILFSKKIQPREELMDE